MEATIDKFFKAIRTGNLSEVERMVREKPELAGARDASGLSAVLTAIYYNQPGTAEILIRNGAPLNLFEAAAAGSLERFTAILEGTPEQINSFSPDGYQPLGLACFFGHAPVVEYLLAHGAEVNTPSRNPMAVRPLNSAVAGGHTAIVKMLLEHGADPNGRQSENFTPLHSAAQNGQMDMIELLMQNGADLSAVSKDQKTAADLARENNHASAVAVLEGSRGTIHGGDGLGEA